MLNEDGIHKASVTLAELAEGSYNELDTKGRFRQFVVEMHLVK